MSRVILPKDAEGIKKLCTNIKAKNIADPDVLGGFLTENGISPAANVTKAAQAVALGIDSESLHMQSEKKTQKRDVLLRAPFAHMLLVIQFLKGFYKINFKTLGDWGITITNSKKIIIPADVQERMTLLQAIIAKHNDYTPGTSPLDKFLDENHIQMGLDKTAATDAQEAHEQSVALAEQSETATQQRDNKLKELTTDLQAIADFLKKYYTKDADKAMGDWGFVVDHSTQKPREQTTKVGLLGKETIQGVKIDGYVKNPNSFAIHLYKGRTTTGNPIIIAPGATWGVIKGYSVITISNPSELQVAKVKVLVSNS